MDISIESCSFKKVCIWVRNLQGSNVALCSIYKDTRDITQHHDIAEPVWGYSGEVWMER